MSLMYKYELLVDFAEMDSPISMRRLHPYGRRRAGTKGSTGAGVRQVLNMCMLLVITMSNVQI